MSLLKIVWYIVRYHSDNGRSIVFNMPTLSSRWYIQWYNISQRNLNLHYWDLIFISNNLITLIGRFSFHYLGYYKWELSKWEGPAFFFTKRKKEVQETMCMPSTCNTMTLMTHTCMSKLKKKNESVEALL